MGVESEEPQTLKLFKEDRSQTLRVRLGEACYSDVLKVNAIIRTNKLTIILPLIFAYLLLSIQQISCAHGTGSCDDSTEAH